MTDALSALLDGPISTAMTLLPAAMNTQRADVMLLAIGLQESRFTHRRQINGPARGFWQFERGGVQGVLNHPASRKAAEAVCRARGVAPLAADVHAALEHDDVLAAAFARLLLFTDVKPLPALGNSDAAWDYYMRNWRPGKPHPKTWDALYAKALDVVEVAA